ncbi:MAG: hypothetical protein HFH86_04965 [Bacilli bacterium]|jgi:hypothetical protein|nr:hypothetical protein [Bacilli bacterium]
MKIFILAGKVRSGKGEVAKSIKKYYDKSGQKTVITEFSKYLKIFAKEMTDWDLTDEKKPRKFLQEIGSYIRKNLRMPNFLIERMKEDFKIYEKFYENIVISDARFVQEIEYFKRNFPDVYIFYIINEHGNYDLSIEESNHESEHALDEYNEFDFMIVNDSKENLTKKMQEILEELG